MRDALARGRLRAVFLLCALVASAPALASCMDGGEPRGAALSLRDPLDLIDDVGGVLRLHVLSRDDGFRCEPTSGQVMPGLPDQENLDQARVNVLLDVVGGSASSSELMIPVGDYTVLVRGKGTDPVTGVRDTIIATACQDVTIRNGEIETINLTLIPVVGSGVCGDTVLSPDEECEDGNSDGGDGCSATCRTEPFQISTTTDNHSRPTVGWAFGRNMFVSFNSEMGGQHINLRVLDSSAQVITSPAVLENQLPLDMIQSHMGIQFFSDLTMAADGTAVIGFGDFAVSSRPTVRAMYMANNSMAMSTSQVLRSDATGRQDKGTRIAVASGGAVAAVFSDNNPASGLSARLLSSGRALVGAEAFELGGGQTNCMNPDVAALSANSFLAVYECNGDVFMQRINDDGSLVDTDPVPLLSGGDSDGTQAAPSVAVLNGLAMIVWSEEGANSDGSGTGLRGVMVDSSGAVVDGPFAANSTTDGDQAAPALASGPAGFLLAFQSGTSIHARLFNTDGSPALNRQPDPTTSDFRLSAAGESPAVAVGGPNMGEAVGVVTYAEGGVIRGRLLPMRL